MAQPPGIDFSAAGGQPAALKAATDLLCRLATAAVRGKGPAVRLKRTVLRCLVWQGLTQREDGKFEMRMVHCAQLGEAVLSAVAADAEQQALYKTPGHTLAEELTSLQVDGIVITKLVNTARYAKARSPKLLRHATAAQHAAGQLPIASAASQPAASSDFTRFAPRPSPAAPRPAARVSHMPAPQLVTTEQAAAAAVDRLLAAGEVAMDCEGALERGGSISLIQLYAPGSSSSSRGSSGTEASVDISSSSGGECCYVFDLVSMSEPVRQAAMRQLARLLESASTTKVLHDCRADCEALFYLYGIRCAGVWDTQVAFGLLQFLCSVGGGDAASDGGVNAPIGLNSLLSQYQLPPNPLKDVMHARMDQEPHLFERRPLEAQVMQYAVADVWQLLPARAGLEADLGPAAAARVEALSAAYSEWCLHAGDRSCTVGTGSYAAAVQLPLGEDLQMDIQPPSYRPRFSPALSPFAEGQPPEQQPAQPLSQLSAAEDPDTQLALELFPERIRSEILAVLAEQEGEGEGSGWDGEAQDSGGNDDAGGFWQAVSALGSRLRPSPALGGGSRELAAAEELEADGDSMHSSSGGDGGSAQLVEVVVDCNRPVRLRLSSCKEVELQQRFEVEDALAHLAAAKSRLHLGGVDGDLFYSDNRAGIPGTLHRISAMKDRDGGVLGLTYRVGRHVAGVGRLILDILHALSQGHDAAGHEVQDAVSPSLLLLGGPGVGKTTLLRDVCGLLSDTFHQKVVVVDSSNEIAGDGREPHPCIGAARRMMVPDKAQQHNTMREAVQNHNPDVIVVDEIGSPREVEAAKSIANRGVVLVGTAHGRSLQALMRNSDLNGLVGGIHQVTLGDEQARRSNHGSKTRTERRGEPAFSTLVEVVSRNRWRVHMSVARSVDDILAGREPATQLRWVADDGRMMVRLEGEAAGRGPGLAGTSVGGSMHGAVRDAARRMGRDGKWFESLLDLAALY